MFFIKLRTLTSIYSFSEPFKIMNGYFQELKNISYFLLVFFKWYLIDILVLHGVLIIWRHNIVLVSSVPLGWAGKTQLRVGLLTGQYWGKMEGKVLGAPTKGVCYRVIQQMALRGLLVSDCCCNKTPQT